MACRHMWVQIRMAVSALLSETAMVSTVFRYGVLADATQLVLDGVDSPLHEVTIHSYGLY